MGSSFDEETQKECKKLWTNFRTALRNVKQTKRCDITVCEEWCTSGELEYALKYYLKELDEVNTKVNEMEDPTITTHFEWNADYFHYLVDNVEESHTFFMDEHSRMLKESYKEAMCSLLGYMKQTRGMFSKYRNAFQECILDTQPTLAQYVVYILVYFFFFRKK